MKVKKIYFLMFAMAICLLFIGITTASAQTLVLQHANGTTTDVELYTQPQVKFQNDKVLITSTVLDMEFPKENVLRFTYKGSTVGISSPNAETEYTKEGNRLVFHNVKSGDEVSVYKTDGIRVPVRLTRAGSDIVLHLSAIPSGVYLLNFNGQTSKCTKQ